MAKARVDSVGEIGLVKDTQYWKIPAHAWTKLNNAVTSSGSIEGGETFNLKEIGADFPEEIKALFSYVWENVEYYILCGKTKVWALSEGVYEEITSSGFTFDYSDELGWDKLIFNGYLILNNGVDEPHWWPLTKQLKAILLDDGI